MYFSRLSAVLLALLSSVNATATRSWPYGPLHTRSRWILNAEDQKVTFAGVNWPGAADAMIPEGLQYASIESIVSKIKSIGMNVIRLTYAIEMIDDIYAEGADVTLKESFIRALGAENGTAVYNSVLKNNPSFTSRTTRLQIFDAVAAECYKQKIYVHLDNHMSKAAWCCSDTDGNGWFGDVYFNVSNWKRGLAYMANHAKSWGSLVSMSLRNELRDPSTNATTLEPYGWQSWYPNMVAAANAIHTANPDVLIYFSGLNYDTDLTPLPIAAPLGGGEVFRKTDFAFEKKLVLESHNYATGTSNCETLESTLFTHSGFNALQEHNSTIVNVLPVVLTEWGHLQNNATYASLYQTCLATYLPEQHVGWMVWVIAGSYYIRSGVQDLDETWGLLNHDWSDWRDPADVNGILKKMIRDTLS